MIKITGTREHRRHEDHVPRQDHAPVVTHGEGEDVLRGGQRGDYGHGEQIVPTQAQRVGTDEERHDRLHDRF